MIDPFINYIDIGYVQRPHGTQRDLLIDLKFTILELKSFVADLEGSKVPFLVEECFITDKKAYVKIYEINNLNDFELLKGARIFTDRSIIQKDEIFFHEIEGYEVIDQREGVLGKVLTVKHMPMQNMLFIDHAGQELLIPYHKDLIIEVDHTNKKITSALPYNFF